LVPDAGPDSGGSSTWFERRVANGDLSGQPSSHPAMDNDYKVKLEIFEGPLDLLLYLIKKDEVDIHDIRIERITKQYLEYMDVFTMLDLEVAGDFVVMAANLIYIKSRSLLPKDQRPPEETAEEDDPRWELVRQLIEYKKFKDAAGHLQQRETAQENLFSRVPEKPEFAAERPISEVSIFDLINAFQNVLKRLNKAEDLREIFEENFTVSDKIDLIMKITASGVALQFSELFAGAASRTEVVVTFLALLELIRLKQLRVAQSEEFGEIEIIRATEAPVALVAER
jgi:segregation and condensation protein A